MEDKNKKMLLSVLVLVVLFAGLITAVVLVRQRQVLEKKASGGSATMSLQPNPVNVTQGQTFVVDVYVNTASVVVSGIDVLVDFSANKSKINLTSITPVAKTDVNMNLKTFVPVDANGNFDAAKVVSTANSTGIVEFGAVAFEWRESDPPSPAPSPTTIPSKAFSGKVATLNFTALQSGSFTISTKVVSAGDTTDVNIVDASGATDVFNGLASVITINVTPSAVSPTPTPTGGTVTNKRDVSGPTVGTPDGNVNSADVGFILKTPYPCGVDYDACESNTKRDVSGPTVGTPDGNVNSADVGFILKTPYPCGVDYDACY